MKNKISDEDKLRQELLAMSAWYTQQEKQELFAKYGLSLKQRSS